jgi:hypothetical protein
VPQELASVAFIIHDQDLDTRQIDGREIHRCLRRCCRRALGVRTSVDGNQRQMHRELRALPLTRAGDMHRSAVQLDEVFDDRQAEAQATVVARRR